MRPDPALGVFDTLLVRDGVAVHVEAHLTRLADSVRELYSDEVDLLDRVRTEADGVPLARLRTTYVPGHPVTVVVTPIEARPSGPWDLVPVTVPGGWGAHKWVDRRPLESPRWDVTTDGLLVDEDGSVLETCRGNIVAVVDGELVTPPLDGRILPGVTRLRLDVVERRLTLADLTAAESVLATSSISGVRPVRSVAGVRPS